MIETKTQAKQRAAMEKLGEVYAAKLDGEMGQLHNRFVEFIAAARLPLPQVLLVLQMLVKETTDEAFRKYIGE